MDSPESNKIVASSSSADSPVVQESPFFNFLRTLSPIKPVKAATNIAQGLSGINIPSPPPVFTSPRLHPQSEIFFLKRSKDFKTSNANSSIDHENRDHAFAAGSEVSERPIGQLMSGLVPCNKKTQETKSVPLAQLSSPTGYVDEYLTDPVEEESMKSSDLASSCLNQVVDGETNSKVDGNNDKFMKNMATGSDEKSKSSGQTEGNTQEMQLAVVEPENIKDGGRRSVECSDLMSEEFKDILLSESDFSQEPASGEENTQLVETQTSQHARVLPHEPVENKTADLEEVSQHQRGTLRRCLQFDASAGRRKFVSSNRGFSNPASINRCSSTSSNPPELETMESSLLVLPTSTNTCTMNSSQPVASTLIPGSSKVPENRVDKCLWNVGNSSLKAPLPSGIGLHLNSIVNAAAKGSTRSVSINSTEKEYQAAQGEKRPSVLKLHILEEYKSTSLPKFVEGKFSAKNHNDQQETESLVAENSSTYKFPYDASDKFQESDQLSLKDTGKRTQPFEDENCKRCNCRRSKCLKLYCECFAAGIYCAEPCACQECFNKPEYEDMVLATRKHIESRNPLAFAPKVVRRVTDSPANSKEDNDKATPASARHKRGCNCKKSMCLKKYCECYQSGVGCSIACRCDGCKNTFGAKDGHDESSGVLSRKVDAETSEDLPEGKPTMETTKMQKHSEHHHSQNLTPSFQTSKHGKGMLKSHLPGRRLSSPESDTNVLSSYAQSPSSPRNLSTHDKRARMGRQGNVDIIFDQVEFSTTGSMDQLSPRWDGFEDMCNITPSAQVSSKSTAMSSPSSSKAHTKVSRVQLQGSVRVSGSLRWRSSPIAPMSWLGESKMCQEGDSDIGYEILDETPDILKDAHTPTKSVKASSPNQKRISPPYNHLHNLRSSPSPALKSGRKFVLQSISSLPSVTPDSDPKESSSTN